MSRRDDSNDSSEFDDGAEEVPWVPEAALESLVAEKTVHPEEDHEATARRLFRENVGQVTLGILHTAVHGSNERVRLDAQKYVVERVLGKVGDDAFDGDRSPVASFIEDVTSFVAQSGS